MQKSLRTHRCALINDKRRHRSAKANEHRSADVVKLVPSYYKVRRFRRIQIQQQKRKKSLAYSDFQWTSVRAIAHTHTPPLVEEKTTTDANCVSSRACGATAIYRNKERAATVLFYYLLT